ncbi:putative modifying wall lignin-1/2 [Helianthus annuus]|nr:putative modifying wall lignin-1/2 [Helianthus annuus]
MFDLVAFTLSLSIFPNFIFNYARIVQDASSRYCVFESDIATGLSVGALLFLLVSQLLVMVATRCLCCGPVLCPGRSRTLAIFLFITCWMTFIIAEACLLAGSVRNAYHTKYRTVLSANPPSCETLRKGVFGAGAAFVVFTGIVSELYYVLYSKSDEGVIPTKDMA